MTRVALATLSLAIALSVSLQGASAGPAPEPTRPVSILPEVVGVGVPSTDWVVLTFTEPADRESVLDSLALRPNTPWRAWWSDDGRSLRLIPERRWRTDARYLITLRGGARRADGTSLPPRHFSFTTETAPVVDDFQLRFVAESAADRVRTRVESDRSTAAGAESPPADTAAEVSSRTRITIGFSAPMLQADVERRFTISPSVTGELSWSGNSLVFEPSERLEPGARYAVSVIGARDLRGNRLGGDASFSFTTREGAQVVKVVPADGARDVTEQRAVLWFSQPMDTEATVAALTVHDETTGGALAGTASWNQTATQLTFSFAHPLAQGHGFRIELAEGSRDLDRNPVTGSWTFASPEPAPVAEPAAPAPPPAPTTRNRSSGPAPSGDVQAFALWQVNEARARHGFAPLRLDAAVSAVASAHAWDMMNNGYFSHTALDGSRVAQRLRRAGVSFSHSGENLCYYNGLGVKGTLQWCHDVFMAEPYPGVFNHKHNILNPRFTRMGIGIAQSGGRIKIVWNFAG